MNNRYLAKTIKKKTSRFFRVSLLLFGVSVALLITSTVLLFSQYQQLETDFFNNANPHLIEVCSFSPKESVGVTEFLQLDDLDNIDTMLAHQGLDDYFVFCEYAINFGISDNNGRIFFVHSYDEKASTFLGQIKADEALCSVELPNEFITLNVPRIDVSEGGFSSSSSSELPLTLVPTASYVEFHSDIIYVGYSTLQHIIEKMYETTWDDFMNRYLTGENFGINIVDRIYVYVDELSDSRSAATLLGKSGYNIVYALGAFEDMRASIDTSLWVFLILGVTVLFVTTASVIISFKNHLIMSQKDIGILKFYGYSENRIKRIYNRIITNIFFLIFSIGTILAVSLSVLYINTQTLLFTLVLLGCLVVFLLGIRFIVISMLLKICKTDTLALIKRTKQL